MIDITTLSDEERVDLLEQAFSSVDEVCSQLTAEEWDLPTDLPGWTVKDLLSHLAHYEAVAVGRPDDPVIDASGLAHVKNEIAAGNERGVEARRGRTGAAVLDEFREVTGERIKALREPGALDQPSAYPLTSTPLRTLWPIRLLDILYHEQDIRRATNRPGHLEGAVAGCAFSQLATRALPRIVAKLAQAPEGSVVVFDVAPQGESFAVQTSGGRGALAEPPADPTVRFRTDFEAFLCLAGGRGTVEQLRADGRLEIEGDPEFAGRILENIVVVP